MEFVPRILPYLRSLDGLKTMEFEQNGGAFSIVKKQILDGTVIALKKAKKKFMIEEENLPIKMFIREVMETIVAAHPAVMHLLGWNFFFYEDNCYNFNLVMATEFCEGGELKGFWTNHSSKIDEFSKLNPKYIQTQKYLFAYGIAIGMKHLHNLSVIHRDLKNENIFLQFPKWDNDNIPDEIKPLFDKNIQYLIPVIADLGLAKYNEDPKQSRQCGSPYYFAPELIKSNIYNFPVDVYAYAVVLSNILRGIDFPQFNMDHKDLNKYGKFTKHVLKGGRPKVNDCTKAQAEYLEKLWVEDPASRPTFDDIVNYLENPHVDNFIFEDYDDNVIKAYKKYIELKLGIKDNMDKTVINKFFEKYKKYKKTQSEFYNIEEEDAHKLADLQSDEEYASSIISSENEKEKNNDLKINEYISSFMNIYYKGKEKLQHEELSQFYLNEGEKSEKNKEYETAEHFYVKSIQLGNLNAITKLGLMLLRSNNITTRSKGIKLLKISSENKDSEGLYYYGYLVSEGDPSTNTAPNEELGAQMLIESGQQGHPRGYYQAATIYHELGIKKAEESKADESRELLERSMRCYKKSYETYKDEESKRLSNELQKYLH